MENEDKFSNFVDYEEVEVDEAPVEEAPVEEGLQVTVDEEIKEAPDSLFPGPHQVEPAYKIFVPFEDFEGRINQEDFQFKKGVAVKVTADQANTWLDAKKGYVK